MVQFLCATILASNLWWTSGGLPERDPVVLSNDFLEATVVSSAESHPAGSITVLKDLQTGVDLAADGCIGSLSCGSYSPMDGQLTVLSDTEAVFSSPGMTDGPGTLPVSIEITYRLVGRGLEIEIGIEAQSSAELEDPLQMPFDLGAFDEAAFCNQAGDDREVMLTGTHGLLRISGDQVVRLEGGTGLPGACVVFPNPALGLLALDDAPPPAGPCLYLRLFDTEPPRETATGPMLHSLLPAGFEAQFFARFALESDFSPAYLSAHPSGLERTASWMLDDIPFRHPPDTTLWAFSESSAGGEWVSAWLIALLESHPAMKMNWIILPDAILAPNCDSMWAEPGFEESWSHWHSNWRLAEFAPSDFRQWLLNIQDDAYPWAGQVSLGSHGYHHTPSPDSAWDPFHEFITYEPEEHLERFRIIRSDLGAIGLDTTLVRALRYPGHRTSLSGLWAAAAYNYDFYCNGIRWYEQMGGEPFIDQYISHYETPAGDIWGSNTVWWGDYPPAPYEYATTVLQRGKHALLGSHPDRMFGWGNPSVFGSIDSICTVFEQFPNFGWLFPEEYGRFLEETSGIRFDSIRRSGSLITAGFSGGASPGLTMVVELLPNDSPIGAFLDGAPTPWELRGTRVFAVLPALAAGDHLFEFVLTDLVDIDPPETVGSVSIRAANPSSGRIHYMAVGLEAGGEYSLFVFDCAGRLSSETTITSPGESAEGSIEMPGAPSGVYFLVLGSGDRTVGSAGTVLLR